MPAIQTILHPTDFSENAGYAFGAACSLAEKFNARLILLHVTPKAQTQAKGAASWPQPEQKITVEHQTAEGNAAEEILRAARSSHCDLIVMGTHGRSGVQRLLLGSVAEEVMRKAACPVLAMTLPPGRTPSTGEKRAALRLQTILHPTDFSPRSEYAFEVASFLAEQYAARLLLLHVIPASSTPFPGEQPFNPLKPSDEQENVKGRFAWPQPPNLKLSVEHRVAEGDSCEEILRLARNAHCDLIVMGTQGRTGLDRVLTGSVAEEVLRNAGCPVLAVKTPAGWTSAVQYSASSRPAEIVDVRPLGWEGILHARERMTLLKTTSMEVARLCLRQHETISDSRTEGETLFQCLEGEVAFTAYGKTQQLEAGRLLYLPRNEFFTITARTDSSLLLTIHS